MQERTTNNVLFSLISIKRVPRILPLQHLQQQRAGLSPHKKKSGDFHIFRLGDRGNGKAEKNRQHKTRIISIEFTNNAHSVGKGELDESIYLTRNHRDAGDANERNRQLRLPRWELQTTSNDYGGLDVRTNFKLGLKYFFDRQKFY